MAKAKKTKTIDGIIYLEDMSEVLGVESKDIKRAVIAEGACVIGIAAFCDCTQLEEIVFSSSLYRVRARAFQNCTSLLRVVLDDERKILNADWFKDLPEQYELICSEKGETFKTIKRSTRLKAHVKSLALSDAKSEKKKQVQSASIDAVLSSSLNEIEGAFYKILANRKTATSVLIKIGKNCGSFKFGQDSAKWLGKVPKIIEILSDQEKEGSEIFKELKESKITLSDFSSAYYIDVNADAFGNLNVFMSGRLKGRGLRIKGNNTLSIFGARSLGYELVESVRDFEQIVLSEGLERIEVYAFSGCEKLKSITIPEGTKRIDYDAFRGCTSLTSIKLPESVEEIASYAFECCSSLSSIHIPKTIKKIGEFAFKGTNIKSLEQSFCIQNNKKWNVDFTIKNGLVTENNTLVYATSNIQQLIVPSGIEKIADYAFRGCKFLKRVKISEGVKKIGIGAFKGCSFLQEVSIPDSIEQIEGFVFEDTAILNLEKTYRVKSAQIRNGGKVVDFSIKDGFAMEDDTLAYVAFNKRKFLLEQEMLVIPDFVRRIDTIGDACKNVVSIFVPASVEEICFASFRGCENLLSIEYGGTKKQWKAIQKADGWDLDLSAKSVRCTDGAISL